MRALMLYQELPRIESTRSTGAARWLAPALIVAAAALTVALLSPAHGRHSSPRQLSRRRLERLRLSCTRDPRVNRAGRRRRCRPRLFAGRLGARAQPRAGALTTAKARCSSSTQPIANASAAAAATRAGRDDERAKVCNSRNPMAWRDGAWLRRGIADPGGISPVEVERVGARGDLLLWRFPTPRAGSADTSPSKRVGCAARLASGSARRAFWPRCRPKGNRSRRTAFRGTGAADEGTAMHAAALRRSRRARRGRAVALRRRRRDRRSRCAPCMFPPIRRRGRGAGTSCCSIARGHAADRRASSNLQALLDVLPIGLALVDRDGRFSDDEQAFRQAAGIRARAMPVYPGDLVVKEDKAAVADAVRRNARGPAMSGDLAVRLDAPARRAGRADDRRAARPRRCGGAAAAQGQ